MVTEARQIDRSGSAVLDYLMAGKFRVQCISNVFERNNYNFIYLVETKTDNPCTNYEIFITSGDVNSSLGI